MNKYVKIAIYISAGLFLSIGGFFIGKNVPEKPTTEVKIGYDGDKKDEVKYNKVLDNVRNQDDIENLNMVLLYAKQVSKAKVGKDNPDFYLVIDSINNEKDQRLERFNSKVWFTESGAIINFGEDDEPDYRKLDKTDASFLKQIID